MKSRGQVFRQGKAMCVAPYSCVSLFRLQVYGQVTLTFRYGREDEEVMGLKFCNEAIMCLAQLFPVHERAVPEPPTPLQVSNPHI